MTSFCISKATVFPCNADVIPAFINDPPNGLATAAPNAFNIELPFDAPAAAAPPAAVIAPLAATIPLFTMPFAVVIAPLAATIPLLAIPLAAAEPFVLNLSSKLPAAATPVAPIAAAAAACCCIAACC